MHQAGAVSDAEKNVVLEIFGQPLVVAIVVEAATANMAINTCCFEQEDVLFYLILW